MSISPGQLDAASIPLPMDGEYRVEAGGRLRAVLFFILISIILIPLLIDWLKYVALGTEYDMKVTTGPLLFMLTLILLQVLMVRMYKGARMAGILLRPGTLSFNNSLAPIPLSDIQGVTQLAIKNSNAGTILVFTLKPGAPIPLLRGFKFGQPDARLNKRKRILLVPMSLPEVAGKRVFAWDIIERVECYQKR